MLFAIVQTSSTIRALNFYVSVLHYSCFTLLRKPLSLNVLYATLSRQSSTARAFVHISLSIFFFYAVQQFVLPAVIIMSRSSTAMFHGVM